jgi:hypothetical protein
MTGAYAKHVVAKGGYAQGRVGGCELIAVRQGCGVLGRRLPCEREAAREGEERQTDTLAHDM